MVHVHRATRSFRTLGWVQRSNRAIGVQLNALHVFNFDVGTSANRRVRGDPAEDSRVFDPGRSKTRQERTLQLVAVASGDDPGRDVLIVGNRRGAPTVSRYPYFRVWAINGREDVSHAMHSGGPVVFHDIRNRPVDGNPSTLGLTADHGNEGRRAGVLAAVADPRGFDGPVVPMPFRVPVISAE